MGVFFVILKILITTFLYMGERESGMHRVVGFDDDIEEGVLKYFKHRFENQTIDSNEKEKSAELLEIIDRVNDRMAEFLKEYGAVAINVPPQNIHILDRAKVTAQELEEIEKRYGTKNGAYMPSKQAAIILKNYEEGKLQFLYTLVHEMLHQQGFYSYQKSYAKEAAEIGLKKDEQKIDINIRRSGFAVSTKDGKKWFFNDVNEAVITELEIRFANRYFREFPELQSEMANKDQLLLEFAKNDNGQAKKLQSKFAGVKRSMSDRGPGLVATTYAYADEREKLADLISDLYKRNQSEFVSEEEVFKLFAVATLTGRLLPVARLIEKTYEKGSFRMIGEMSAVEWD